MPVELTPAQDYVKKTEASAKDVEQQLQSSEKRRCGAEEELKLIAGEILQNDPNHQMIVLDAELTAEAGEVVLMRTRAAESAGDALSHQAAIMVTPPFAVELETRTQAFAIERDALVMAAAESAACIKTLQAATATAEAQIIQQARELQETKAIDCAAQ